MLERNRDSREELQLVSIDSLVPEEHLLRKIEKVVNFNKVYEMTESYYCLENGRPAVDPVILVKMCFIQHLYGIKSLRQTVKEIEMNMAYRWFLGFDFMSKIPHFATLSYAISTRFPSELFESIFSWILEEVVNRGYVDAQVIFIDGTHIKANANRKKHHKELSLKTARAYDIRLREEINEERIKTGHKPFDDDNPKEITVTKSSSDKESGLFVKGEHKSEFSYEAHVSCDRNNYILSSKVTPGNVHDSIVFDDVYDETIKLFPEAETVAVDAGYKTPWICKKVIEGERNISTAYKRPAGKEGYFRPYEYVYDDYYNCVLCPENKVLKYSSVNREGYKQFRSNPADCSGCPSKYKCTVSESKTVLKHIWEGFIDLAEDFRHSPKGKETYSLRAQTIERVFADAKEKHSMRYTFFKGLSRVTKWIKLKFAAMNLKKMAIWAYN